MDKALKLFKAEMRKMENYVSRTIKFFLILATAGLIGAGIYYAYEIFVSEESVSMAVEEILNDKPPAEKKMTQVKKNKNATAEAIPKNPFISNKEISTKAAEKFAGESKAEAVVISQVTTPVTLPQIPKTQIQMQQVKIPKAETSRIINPMTMETQEVKSEGNVQGIITTDGGKNIAIMSNGEVLTEGERYLDGRIAYIGGDGVEMDNGKKIKLKEQ